MFFVNQYIGAFYMWEELRANIVPMVILGAFELYPAKSWVNLTGKVTVRYLPPIKVTDSMTRSEVCNIVSKVCLFYCYLF